MTRDHDVGRVLPPLVECQLAECHFAECEVAKCHLTEYHFAECKLVARNSNLSPETSNSSPELVAGDKLLELVDSV